MKYKIFLFTMATLMLATALAGPALASPQRFDEIYTKALRVTNVAQLWGGADLDGQEITLDADADTSITSDTDDRLDFEIGGVDELTLTAGTFDYNDTLIDQALNTENLGTLPSIITATLAYTPASSALATVTDGEVWIIHEVLIDVDTNFDCTGNDCVVTVGDGNDPNGFLDLVDAELQAADAEGMGFAAGWQGLSASTRGVYLSEAITGSTHRFIYAPSGADETIDYVVGGTSPAAGSATVYIIYTRIQ